MPPSLLLNALAQVYAHVEHMGVRPVVAGGLAVAYWGHPRSTQDIDLAVLVSDELRFEADLRRAKLLPARSRHVVDLGFVRVSQWKFMIEDAYMDCEVDFLLAASSYYLHALDRALHCEFQGIGRPLRVLSCEDLMLFKAASGRLIDLADIKTLHDIHCENLDFGYLSAKAQELQLPSEFWLRC